MNNPLSRQLILTACVCAAGLLFSGSARIGVFHNHLATMAAERKVTLEEAVKAARSWGVEGIDIFDEFDRGESAKMIELGMKCGAFVVSADLGAGDDREKLARSIAEARRLKASVIMLVPGQIPQGTNRSQAWSAAKPRIAAFAELAATNGLRVALEDFDWGEPIVGSAAHLRRAFAEIPRLGHVLDTGNYDRWGDDPLACTREFLPRIVHVHAKDLTDSVPPGTTAAGTGRIPMERIVRELHRAHYDGWVTIECFGVTNTWDAVETAARNLKSMFANAKETP